MDLDQIQQLVDEHLELLTVDARGILEARERASKFLVVQSVISTFLRQWDERKAKMTTIYEATYAKACRQALGKNITEKKINVAEDNDYSDAREAVEVADSIRDWLKTHIKIFENAHITFRQYSKE